MDAIADMTSKLQTATSSNPGIKFGEYKNDIIKSINNMDVGDMKDDKRDAKFNAARYTE